MIAKVAEQATGQTLEKRVERAMDSTVPPQRTECGQTTQPTGGPLKNAASSVTVLCVAAFGFNHNRNHFGSAGKVQNMFAHGEVERMRMSHLRASIH